MAAACAADGSQLTREFAVGWVEAYGEAWRLQDADCILKLYTEDATYSERPYDPENGVYRGHAGIRAYWEGHVSNNERDIDFRQLAEDLVWDTESRTAVAQWEAKFSVAQPSGAWKRVQFLQVAILSFAPDGRVRRFQEWWHGRSLQRAAKGMRDPRARRKRCGEKRRPPELGGRTCAHAALWGARLGPFERKEVRRQRQARLRPGEAEHLPGDETAATPSRVLKDEATAVGQWQLKGVPLVPSGASKGAVVGMAKSSDLVEWYRRAAILAGLATDSDVNGVPLLGPPGAFLWEELQRWVDAELSRLGALPFRSPVLAHHADGHKEGDSEQSLLEVRESTEVLLYTAMAKHWVKSSEDLPVILRTWGSAVTTETVRRPLLFLRSRELLLQEGHAAFAATAPAAAFADAALGLYLRLCEELLAVSPRVREVPSRVGACAAEVAAATPGADVPSPGDDAPKSVSIEVPMPGTSEIETGGGASAVSTLGGLQAVEVAAVHHLGRDTAAHFRLNYAETDAQGKYVTRPCAQICYSVTSRALGAALCVHGDDVGLVLPPRLAPVQVVIIAHPGSSSQRYASAPRSVDVSFCGRLVELLTTMAPSGSCTAWESAPVRVQVDCRKKIGAKQKVRLWKQRGVPLVLLAEAPPFSLVPRDRSQDLCGALDESAPEAVARAVRRELAALHGRLLAAHRAACAAAEEGAGG